MYSILVVDDEHDLRKHIVSLLSSRGYQVDEAADGLEAAELLARKTYPLILCDVRMPRMTGLELLRFIQTREYASTVALITAHGNIREAID
ncbi:response regulator, partial [bacterium]|nr:response regulator [bacterium]